MMRHISFKKHLDISLKRFVKIFWWIWISKKPRMDTFRKTNPNTLLFYSVRSGFDALLSALELPAGSEILCTAVNIPSMIKIIKIHNLKAVTIDMDPDTLSPNLDDIENKINPNTKVILFAHLFGRYFNVDIDQIKQIKTRYPEILIIEDCAESFPYCGNKQIADVTMNSFGTIKFATCCNGAVFYIKNDNIFNLLSSNCCLYPVQSNYLYFTKVLKCLCIQIICSPYVYGAFVDVMQSIGADPEQIMLKALSGFVYNSDQEYVNKLRLRPCGPLQHCLIDTILNVAHDVKFQSKMKRRSIMGQRGMEILGSTHGITVPGSKCSTHHYFWLFPIVLNTSNVTRKELCDYMLQKGFDLTYKTSKLIAFDQSVQSCAKDMMDGIVYVPMDMELTRFETMCFEIRKFVNKPTKSIQVQQKKNSWRIILTVLIPILFGVYVLGWYMYY
eukprot:273442_1